MKTMLISINKCEPGMVVAQDIFNDYGAIIVSENSVIDENIIEKFEAFRVEKVLVYEKKDAEEIKKREELRIRQERKEEFKKNYVENVDNIKNVLKDISNGKDFEVSQIDGVVNAVLKSKLTAGDIYNCVSELRDTDEYTYTHCVNVAILSMMIGRWLKYDEKMIKDLIYAGLLHDIGKAKIDLAILNKPGKLTDEEYDEIKKHVLYGYRILENIPGLDKNVVSAVLMHHEREDGSGYILGVEGEKLHEYSKIVAVADVFDAMTANRVYRKKICPFNVFEHIEEEMYSKFDPKITLSFLRNMAEYYVGDKCKLSSGQIGEIIKINHNSISSPLVKVGNEYIDLSKETDLKIDEIL